MQLPSQFATIYITKQLPFLGEKKKRQTLASRGINHPKHKLPIIKLRKKPALGFNAEYPNPVNCRI